MKAIDAKNLKILNEILEEPGLLRIMSTKLPIIQSFDTDKISNCYLENCSCHWCVAANRDIDDGVGPDAITIAKTHQFTLEQIHKLEILLALEDSLREVIKKKDLLPFKQIIFRLCAFLEKHDRALLKVPFLNKGNAPQTLEHAFKQEKVSLIQQYFEEITKMLSEQIPKTISELTLTYLNGSYPEETYLVWEPEKLLSFNISKNKAT